MKAMVRRLLKNVFGLVHYERVDEVWSRWIHYSHHTERQHTLLMEEIRILAEVNGRQNASLEEYRKSNKDLLLRALILDVAPVESMGRALEILQGEPYTDRIARAVKELEHGVELYRKSKFNGGVNANNGSAA